MEEKEPKKIISRKKVPVNFIIPNEIITHYASEMMITNQHTEFILSFFEIRSPLGVPPSDMSSPDLADALCVARIAISADRIPSIIAALNDSFNRFLNAREALIKMEEEEAGNADNTP